MQFKGASLETKMRTTTKSFSVSEVYYKNKRFLLISSKFVLCRERGQNLVLRFNGGPLNTRPVFVNVSRLQLLTTKMFIFFSGYFDQQLRQNLFTSWASHLQQAHIQFRPDIARVEVRKSTAIVAVAADCHYCNTSLRAKAFK